MITEVRDLTRQDYELFRKLVYEKSGINLGDQKMQLVRARLGKRVRQDGFPSFRAYYEHVANDPTGVELSELLDAISTNTTHLFREPKHFEFLHAQLTQWASDSKWRHQHRTVRIWSAACSSGEEPHSIAMTAFDALGKYPNLELRILATDISSPMLTRAQRAVYDMHRVGTVPREYQLRFLKKVVVDGQQCLQLAPELRRLIKVTRFNLMNKTFPFRNRFDIIFCRNVMIYFDRPTQETLVRKLTANLHEDGVLLIGHSESLTNLKHELGYVQPTIYRKQ